MIKVCKICGNEFETEVKRQQMCGSIECRREYQMQIWRKSKEKSARKRNKSNAKKITDLAVEARKHGMTYGQYVAKMYLEGVK